ncbi:MAG: hypothetical protein JNN07_10605 [Verrucomicrobiales bacterium]|nr:hypothetical protein [Verrucomicrobiales bacterium]
MTTLSGIRAILLLIGGLAAAFPGYMAVAEETVHSVLVPVSSTTLSGYVDTSTPWNVGPTSTQIPEPGSAALFALAGVALYAGARAFRKPR